MYSKKISEWLDKNGISIGDEVSLEFGGKMYEGILLDNPTHDTDIIAIKLENGYNVGIKFNENIHLVKKHAKPMVAAGGQAVKKGDYDLAIQMFGGTIASKVEYRTGAVFPSMSAEEFKGLFPELGNICKPSVKSVMSILSEDMAVEHWKTMGSEIYSELKEGKPVVATHGTDTMGYSAAAISFMILNPMRPVVFTGAQRSSDRGSSDNKENLLNSAYYAHRGKPGVFVCMHASTNDGKGYVHIGTRVRKMHTSRRDAFRSVNAKPVAAVDYSQERIEYLSEIQIASEPMEFRPTFNDNVALIYIHPSIKPEFIRKLSEYDGVVLMVTGLGHVPTNPFGDTRGKPIIKEVSELVKSGVHVVAAPQTLYGRMNMNVYTAGRILKEAGVIGHMCNWLPETAFVKLSWVLGQTKDRKGVEEMMYKNYAGELSERSMLDDFEE